MKKPLLLSASLLSLGLITAIYAQTTTTGGSIVDKMKAAAHSFSLSSFLNPTDTGLTSDPIKGKKTGDMLTAGEWNRMLELVSEGGTGGGESNIIKGVATVGFTNGQPHSTMTTVNFGRTCSNPVIVVQSSYDSISCGNGSGIITCSTGGTSQDLHAYFGNVTSTGFQVYLSATSGVWVGAVSPAFGIHYIVACDGASIGGVVGSGWEDVSINDSADFDTNCEYRAYVPKNAQQTDNSWQYFIAVTPKRLRSAPSNDSEIYIPNTDKKAFYFTPYGRADAWGLLVTKMEKRCGGGGGSSATCPSGFVAVGSYCIEPTMSPKGKTWYEAGVACADKGAQLCQWSEWAIACKKGKLTDVQFGTTNGVYEWIDDYTGDTYQGIADPRVYSNCEYLSRADPKGGTTPVANIAYRCCTAQK